MYLRVTVMLLVVTLCSLDAMAQRRSFLERLGFHRTTSLADTEIADGLKEALTVGVENVVEVLRKENGYFGNDKIRIPLPKPLDKMESTLRRVGYGPKIDEFILSMNRAAEDAAPAARDIFVDAVAAMSIEDARAILKGNDTAATDYFKERTIESLTEAFTPIVKQRMAQYEVVGQYNQIVGRYRSIPFIRKYSDPNVEGYTVQKALDGLFYTLGKEEKKIREDPSARITDLLKKVFAD